MHEFNIQLKKAIWLAALALTLILGESQAWCNYSCSIYSSHDEVKISSFNCQMQNQEINILLKKEEEQNHDYVLHGNAKIPIKYVHSLLLRGKCLARDGVFFF